LSRPAGGEILKPCAEDLGTGNADTVWLGVWPSSLQPLAPLAGFSVYSSVGIWQSLIVALIVGSAATAVIGALSRTGRIVEVLGFVPAFALLSWPPMWLIVVLVRYWLTGDTA
jgi:hypothetical protein